MGCIIPVYAHLIMCGLGPHDLPMLFRSLKSNFLAFDSLLSRCKVPDSLLSRVTPRYLTELLIGICILLKIMLGSPVGCVFFLWKSTATVLSGAKSKLFAFPHSKTRAQHRINHIYQGCWVHPFDEKSCIVSKASTFNHAISKNIKK